MRPDDPLFDFSEDRTVAVPTPGRRHLRTRQTTRGLENGREGKGGHKDFTWTELPAELKTFGSNPLVGCASVILSLVSQLRDSLSFPDIEGLKAYVTDLLNRYDDALHGMNNVETWDHKAAHYVLCAFLDETVLRTPWGNDSDWGKQSLLIRFHNDAWGGEKFFRILEQAAKEPARRQYLLELLFVCLSLGFEGKYGLERGGHQKLEQVKDNLYRTLRMYRGDIEQDLSPHWRGVEDRRNPLVRYVPLWVFFSITAAILVVMFIGLRLSLNKATYPVYEGFNQIGREQGRIPAKTVQELSLPQAPAHRLSELLRLEINQGLIEFLENRHGALIRLRGEGLFRSGSAVVSEGYRALISRIADALGKVPGQILVTGHTDNIPIRSMHFSSNWELSRARAEAVVRLLARRIGSSRRLVPEGRADTEPLVPNDSPANRARNRRVEISIIYGRG